MGVTLLGCPQPQKDSGVTGKEGLGGVSRGTPAGSVLTGDTCGPCRGVLGVRPRHVIGREGKQFKLCLARSQTGNHQCPLPSANTERKTETERDRDTERALNPPNV